HPIYIMDILSSEMVKYASNNFLATKISFINEMANLCERVGADINEVRRGIGHDRRIGFSFLFPGVGYGGSCFPKDIRAMIAVGAARDFETSILQAVDDVNQRQKSVLFNKISRYFGGELQGKKIAVWGLAFKPQTDDIREASSLELIRRLLDHGARVHAHDPVAMENVKHQFGDSVTFHDHHYDTLDSADALAILTEWNAFRTPDFSYLKHKLAQPVVFDGRNLYDPARLAELGFYYSGIGIGRTSV
ncbi:MAG: UDP-glucose/GDP-mannose dehydrogenase family protein, partial [Planctomycetaceae bacterium]|nr:UDP-glucose/GDP-mannose dehydrogenase family protein [Planctomycetaceae bacterium]